MRESLGLLKSLLYFCIFIAILVVAGFIYRHYEMLAPSTSDASLQADLVPIASNTSGRVHKVFVKNNELVRANQILFILDDTQQRAAYQKAKVAAQKAEDTYNRYAAVSASGGISKEVLESAAIAKETAVASLKAAKHRLDNMTIRASDTGIINNFYLEPGQYVTSAQNIGVLIIKHSAWVRANILEPFLANIRIGQPATFSLRMYPGLTFKGVVTSVGYGVTTNKLAGTMLPYVDPQFNWVYLTKRFPVRVKVMSKDPFASTPFRVGASVTVTIDTQKHV